MSGSGASRSTNATYTLNQILKGYTGQSTTNYQGWFAARPVDLEPHVGRLHDVLGDLRRIGVVLGSWDDDRKRRQLSSFTLSLTKLDSTTGLLSTTYQTVQGGQGSQPYTLTQTTDNNYTETVTKSFVATETNTAGSINETVTGGTSGSYNTSELTLTNGFAIETINAGGFSSSYKDTYTPTGETASGSSSSANTLTLITGTTSTVTTSTYESSYSYSFPGAIAPTVSGLLSSWGVVGSGSSSGAGGSASGSGSGGVSSSSGSFGSSGSQTVAVLAEVRPRMKLFREGHRMV